MDQLDIAIHQTAHDFGLPRLARMMGINEQVLRNKVNPHADHSPLSLRQAIAMMNNTGDLRILDAIEAQFGRTAHAMPQARRTILDAVLHAVSEQGDVSRAVGDALDDGRITPRELAGIRQEIAEAAKALSSLEASLTAQAEAMVEALQGINS